MQVAPGASFETVADGFATGLAGTIGVRVTDNQGATTITRVTAGIAEYPAGSGIYTKTLTAPTTAGQYTIVWDDGTVSPSDVATDELVVTYTPITAPTGNLYITRTEMRTALQYGTGATYADDDIDLACATVSRALDRACGKHRRFYQATETRYYTPDWDARRYFDPWWLERAIDIDDCVSVSTLTVDTAGDGSYATTWTQGTEFFLGPVNAAADLFPYEQIILKRPANPVVPWTVQNPLKVTGVFGWPTVPPEVSQYAKIFAAQLVLRSRQAPFGILMQGMEVGATARLMRVDPDFGRLLGDLLRTRPFV